MALPVFSEWQQICWAIMLGDGANVCVKISDWSLGAGKQNGSSWLRISKTLKESLRSVHKEI